MNNIKTPNAAVIVWSYQDRLSHNEADASSINKISEIVLNTVSLISIRTSKSKSDPAGTFQITLAPLKNWVSFLSPGSWCAILMSQDHMGPIEKSSYKAKPNELKMLGRINSVRVAVRVDENGAKRSIYIIDGEDWGSVFKSVVYVDPAYRSALQSTVGTAAALTYETSVKQLLTGRTNIPTTTENMNTLINLWGAQNSILDMLSVTAPNNVIRAESSFIIPDNVRKFLNENTNSVASIVSNNIKNATGILDSYDKYKETKESVGIIHPDSITGTHIMWDLLRSHCNEIVNELITDIRWIDNKPKLTLYKRVRPFLTENASTSGAFGSLGQNISVGGNTSSKIIPTISSKFEHVKRTLIPLEDVISIDAGTNWLDKINFIEILPDEKNFIYNGQTYNIATAVKNEAQIYDKVAFAREGMKGLTFQTNFFPISGDGTPDFFNPSAWKTVLAQWYFNNHNYLNGTTEFIGQSTHIEVGSNIMIDAIVLGPSNNMSSKQLNRKSDTYLLLHVENISHNFFVDDQGARHFRTVVHFTRGVLTNANGKPISLTAIDVDSSLMNAKDERNKANTVTTSGADDPDVEKVKGT